MAKPLNIFMVDDDRDDQELFLYTIRQIDPSLLVTFADHGIDGLARLEDGLKPDIIFLDLNMPRMNGKEFLTKIKANSHWSGIPVVIQTTARHPAIEKEVLDLGADLFIVKNSDLDKQREEVAHILEKFSFTA